MTRYKYLSLAGFASVGAGIIHAEAIGLHIEHPSLARIFVVMAIAQIGWGMWALLRAEKPMMLLGVGINAVAVGGWIVSRFVGISFIPGLEVRESVQWADSLCAVLGVLVLCSALLGFLPGEKPLQTTFSLSAIGAVALLAFPALWVGATSVHKHAHEELALVDSGLRIDASGVIISPDTTVLAEVPITTSTISSVVARIIAPASTVVKRAPTTTVKISTTTVAPTTTISSHAQTSDQLLAAASGWPRAYDPAKGEDFSGIAGATPEQKTRAMTLMANTARDLAKFSDQKVALAEGFVSIGDQSTGFEHLMKASYLTDDRVFDTTAPESLVYLVSGTTRTLVSVMFMAKPGTPINDSTLVNYAGGLMQWHVHTNLCWTILGKVAGVTDAAGNCAPGTFLNPAKPTPMVHVWIAAHPCGPFAALEGNGAGIADLPDSQRVDKCNGSH